MSNEKKYPKLVVGSFIINENGEVFLRTTPSQDHKYTCVNAKVEWGETIEQTLRDSVKKKTNLTVAFYELIGLTDGLNVPFSESETQHMVFADYKVFVRDSAYFFSDDSSRKCTWMKPKDWLEMDKNLFGPYIYEVIEKLRAI